MKKVFNLPKATIFMYTIHYCETFSITSRGNILSTLHCVVLIRRQIAAKNVKVLTIKKDSSYKSLKTKTDHALRNKGDHLRCKSYRYFQFVFILKYTFSCTTELLNKIGQNNLLPFIQHTQQYVQTCNCKNKNNSIINLVKVLKRA